MFRSVDMSYLQVFLPAAVAEEFADQIAREGCMQFTDLNRNIQPFQRQFTGDIIKIQEIERQAKAIEELLDSYDIPHDTDVNGNDLQEEKRPPNATQIMPNIAREIAQVYQRLKEQANVESQLRTELTSQKNVIRVLRQIDTFLQSQTQARNLLQQQRSDRINATEAELAIRNTDAQGMGVSLLEQGVNESGVGLIFSDGNQDVRDVGFKYFAGVVSIAQRPSFERQVFLTSRGNSFIQFEDEQQDLMSQIDGKIPFVLFFLGDQLRRQLKRLCLFMNIQICYESDNPRSREELLHEAENKRNDFDRIHTATLNQLLRAMSESARRLKGLKVALTQEKAIRITLNKFKTNQANNFLTAEGWCPTDNRRSVSRILDSVTKNKGVGQPIIQDGHPKGDDVPTHFITNSFTETFQLIVDTYGVPRYKEFNPTVPTIITFPFLFGVMYGDIFHGSFLFCAALLIIIFYDKLKDNSSEILGNLVTGRWVILLMGAFAIYCGLIYNDCMSIMINGFNGSQWGYALVYITDDGDTTVNTVMVQDTETYAFGIDPVWHSLTNQLTFENSLKMKLSVIIGVTQMTFGLLLKLSNHLYERDVISIVCEFIPQFIFMMVFFGYMIFLIIYKWCIDWNVSELTDTPSLITILIKMVLSPGTLTDDLILYDENTQKAVQVIFVLLMVIAIPWMLIPKPFLLRAKYNREQALRQMSSGVQNVDEENPAVDYGRINDNDDMYEQKEEEMGGKVVDHGHGMHEEFDFAEVFIHQLIHTIEYVLGTISNTASYLRLWALSLAHAELSEVFFEKTLQTSLETDYGVLAVLMTVGAQFMFLMFTFGVLLVMDVLECFLHALRLHWVEFQNKFFYADGVAFKPFAYATFLDVDG